MPPYTLMLEDHHDVFPALLEHVEAAILKLGSTTGPTFLNLKDGGRLTPCLANTLAGSVMGRRSGGDPTAGQRPTGTLRSLAEALLTVLSFNRQKTRSTLA